MCMLRQMLVYINEVNRAKEAAKAEAEVEKRELEARLRREVALQARQAQLARDRLHELESMREDMQETLMNHKREVLMEHKVLSTNIQTELAGVEEQKAEADKKYKAVLMAVSEMEGRVRMLEQELREHSKQSAIGPDGRVNVGHTRKKKRLDGEVERAVDKLAAKREQLSALQAKVDELDALRAEKEEQMRDIEGTLVGVLVEQQRQLMSVLQNSSHKLIPESLQQRVDSARSNKSSRGTSQGNLQRSVRFSDDVDEQSPGARQRSAHGRPTSGSSRGGSAYGSRRGVRITDDESDDEDGPIDPEARALLDKQRRYREFQQQQMAMAAQRRR